jgi:hypothetical protein
MTISPAQAFFNLFYCCALLVPSCVFGQGYSLRGIILDEELKPVPYSSVVIKDDSTKILLGTISDLTGNFKLQLPAHYDNDTLKISSVGFETLLIAMRQIRKSGMSEFRLRTSTTTLPAVVFRGLTARQLIEACVKEIPVNYRNVSFLNSAYYWKATKEDSVYKAMEEGTLTVDEDHGLDASNRSFSYDSVVRRGEAQRNFISFDDHKNLFFFDFIRTGSGITNLDNLNEWKLEYLNINSEHALNATVVKATRHDKLGHFIIYINPMDYSFERVEFSYQWPSTLHSLDNSKLYKLDYVNGVVQYQKTDKKYSIKYLFCSFAYSICERYTFKKVLSRVTDFEFTLLSSAELKYGMRARKRPPILNNKQVIVNTPAYCGAVMALEGRSESCNFQKTTP